jgi:hypothetical protein
MKRQKFTVRFYEMVQHEEVVEAESEGDAWDQATDGIEVEWCQPCTVTNNKTGKSISYQEDKEDCDPDPYS